QGVRRPLAGDCMTVKLPRQPHGKIANVDPFLYFPFRLGADLARFGCDDLSKALFMLTSKFANAAHEFAPVGSGNDTPLAEGGGSSLHGLAYLHWGCQTK